MLSNSRNANIVCSSTIPAEILPGSYGEYAIAADAGRKGYSLFRLFPGIGLKNKVTSEKKEFSDILSAWNFVLSLD